MIENGSLVREDVPDDTCNSMITFFMERSVKYFFKFLLFSTVKNIRYLYRVLKICKCIMIIRIRF